MSGYILTPLPTVKWDKNWFNLASETSESFVIEYMVVETDWNQ